MKKTFTLLLFFVCSIACAQDYTSLIVKAKALYDSKDYAQSVVVYKQVFKLKKKNRIDLYNAARSAALAGEKKLAFRWLNLSFKNYHTNLAFNLRNLKSDTNLILLHGSKRWDKLVKPMQKEVDKLEANYDKPLQAQLLQIGEDDQKYRQQIKEIREKYGQDSKEMQGLWKLINATDSINLIKVTAILDKYGWVGVDKVGEQANQTLFLVIQHARPAAQKKYLPMMREAVKANKASSSALALLEDRVALGEGKRQIYGSQIGRDNDTGKNYVLPLEDPDNVDKRRTEVGLGPLADYVKKWNIDWNVEVYKKQLPEIEARQELKN